MSEMKINSLLSLEEENEDIDMVMIEDNNEPNADNNRKRSLSITDNSSEQDVENPQNEPEPIESMEFPELQNPTSALDLMSAIQKLSRSELEDMCTQKILDVLALKNRHAELREQIRKNQREMATFENKRNELRQQYKDLNIVHKQLLEEVQTQKCTGIQEALMPLMITRSVGIQVNIISANEANKRKYPQQPAPE